MKTRLLLFVMIWLMYGKSIMAQQQEDTKSTFSFGVNAAIYKQNPLGVEAKWMREKVPSFMLRLNYFNIDNKLNEMASNRTQILTHHFTMQGVTFKPGIILLQHRDKNSYLYLGAMGVVTASIHSLNFTYNDAFGPSNKTFNQNHLNYGAELEFGSDIFISSKLYLGLQVKTGIKQTDANLFNNTVSGHNSYYGYTPSQGYGKEPLYVNFGLSLGVHL